MVSNLSFLPTLQILFALAMEVEVEVEWMCPLVPIAIEEHKEQLIDDFMTVDSS